MLLTKVNWGPPLVDFGQTLRTLREENGWSQKDLAALAGYASTAFLSRVERGLQPAGAEAVDALVRALRGHASDDQLRRLLRAAGRPDDLPEDARRRLERVLSDPTLPPQHARVAEEILVPLLGLLGGGPLPAEVVEALRTAAAGLLRLAELAAGRPA
jgi:transcriptional regulator with XRE-family HTH domain